MIRAGVASVLMLVMVNGVEREKEARVDADGVGVGDDKDDSADGAGRGPLGIAMGLWSCNQGRGRTAVRPADFGKRTEGRGGGDR